MAMTQCEFTMTVLMNDMGWLSRQISDCLSAEVAIVIDSILQATACTVETTAQRQHNSVIIDFWRFAYAAWPCVWTREYHEIILHQKYVSWFLLRAWRRGLKVLAHASTLEYFVLFGSLFGWATFIGRIGYSQWFKERGNSTTIWAKPAQRVKGAKIGAEINDFQWRR